MSAVVHLLCAGAAQGLVRALQPRFAELTGATIEGRFGAVGAMKEALLAGEPCDLMIVTAKMIGELVAAGQLRADGRAALGQVFTGIAVRGAEPRPDVATPDALRAALRAASAIYFPDPVRATAGIHFAGVMRALGVDAELAPRCRSFANGATAMRELAAQGAPGAIGCTQVSEILYTEGVTLVAPLPSAFALGTVYSAAVAANAAEPELAAQLVALLAGEESRPLRAAGGFEV
jgi:molybdate transport system substrate-binding protein